MWICKTKLRSRVMPSFSYTWNAIAAFSEESVAKLVHHAVLLLYLVVSSALVLVAARVRRELQGSVDFFFLLFYI